MGEYWTKDQIMLILSAKFIFTFSPFMILLFRPQSPEPLTTVAEEFLLLTFLLLLFARLLFLDVLQGSYFSPPIIYNISSIAGQIL